MAFLDLVNELTGTIPGLSPLLAEKYINRAWKDIRNERQWSFLVTDAGIVCPTQITDGTIAITQFSETVVCDADASTALLAQQSIGEPPLTRMSIRFGATSPAIGQVYNIVAVDDSTPAAVELTLNRMVLEATDADAGYQCYRPYITPPSDDFLSWEMVVDMVNAWPVYNAKSPVTSAYFDLRDPQRQAQGLAYYLGSYAGAYTPSGGATTVPFPSLTTGTNVYELWPHPTSGQTFYARYRRQGVDFTSPTEILPDLIPESLVIQRALGYHAYPFAMANRGSFPAFKGVSDGGWLGLINNSKKQYQEDLVDAKRNDNERALQDVWNRGHGLRTGYDGFKGLNQFPIDSNFMQSHLVRF